MIANYSRSRNSKRVLRISLLLLLLVSGFALCASAQSGNISHGGRGLGNHAYDVTYLPVTKATLVQEINASSHDPIQLYLLIRQAHLQSFDSVAFKTLDALRHRQPKNAVALAAYCLAYQTFGGSPQFSKDRSGINPSGSLQYDYQKTLQQAYSLDSNLWLSYVVEGHSLIAIPDQALRSLSLLQQAVKLKPDISITHYYLGYAYTVGDPRFMSYAKAEQQFQIASRLKPVLSDVKLAQLDLYSVRIPDRAKARRAKREYLATLPVRVNFGTWTKQLLAMTSDR